MLELLPCPFCGRQTPDEIIHNGSQASYYQCDGCGASGPWEVDGPETCGRWNTRAPSPELVASQDRCRLLELKLERSELETAHLEVLCPQWLTETVYLSQLEAFDAAHPEVANG